MVNCAIVSSTYSIQHRERAARHGQIYTKHGVIETPAYLPCATHGSLRGVTPAALQSLELEVILSNAYHLYLRPGIEVIERLGGLHTFMGWDRAILTDSGGFQAFALPKFVKYGEEGITFRSHLDGAKHQFTPELVVNIQERLGVDIATCLDVCTGFPVPERTVARAVDQTNRWAERSVAARTRNDMLLYGMVQGSTYRAQRERSARFLADLPFDGFAIGGNMYTFGATINALVAEKPQMWETVAYTTALLPDGKPRHLLGVGEPADIIAGVAAGIDTFDCVMATRIARHGAAWVRTGVGEWGYERVNLAGAAFRLQDQPLDEQCSCPACVPGVTRAYLHHLIRENDPAAGALLSLHNVSFLRDLASAIREAIATNSFAETFGAFLER